MAAFKSQSKDAEIARLTAKNSALLIERDFWVQQGRQLQNALQSTQRMYADLFDQLGHGVVTDQSLKDNLALASAELRTPIATVEATRAMVAMLDPQTQGAYTALAPHQRTALREK